MIDKIDSSAAHTISVAVGRYVVMMNAYLKNRKEETVLLVFQAVGGARRLMNPGFVRQSA